MAHDHLSEMLDLDAEVLHEHIATLTGWIAGHVTGPVDTLLDLGAGTGTGTFALLREFPHSSVTAVDADPEMLRRLADKARGLGLADRVRTVAADLDTAWPDLAPVDLAWASASMHHMADPDDALTRLHAAVRPGGLVAVVELHSMPRFLPEGDALEERCNAIVDAERARRHVTMDTDWPTHFVKAGFTVEEERRFALRIDPPVPAVARRYAQVTLQRIRHGVEEQLTPADRAALDALLDPTRPQSVQRRDDLSVRTDRIAWLLRRP